MDVPSLTNPFVAVGAGVALVLGLILALRVHAFLALLAAALLVSVLTVGSADAVGPVLTAFGATAGKVGVVIALAAIIGRCLLASGAAERIVSALVGVLGERRAPAGLLGGGFALAIPVFFDTVFYLLVPLARALHLRTHAGYTLCLLAVAIGAAGAHALVPPTPGPLIVAEAFGVGVAEAIAVGLAVAAPACGLAFAFAHWLDRETPLSLFSQAPGTLSQNRRAPARDVAPRTFPVAVALAPVVLPLGLIGTRAAADAWSGPLGPGAGAVRRAVAFLGDPSVALFAAALGALGLLAYAKRETVGTLAAEVEASLSQAGVIILITAAGGAFGGALQATGVDAAIAGRFDLAGASGAAVLLGAWSAASLLKVAQGSSTVAMIVASGMIAAVVDPATLSYSPAYLAVAVGSGSLVGSWMNDSGFWIFAEMGGLTTEETLRTWTPAFAMVGVAALAITLVLSFLAPLR